MACVKFYTRYWTQAPSPPRFTSLEGNRDHKILRQKQSRPYFVEIAALTPSEQLSRMPFRVSESRTSVAARAGQGFKTARILAQLLGFPGWLSVSHFRTAHSRPY